MLEAYQTYSDYSEIAELTENLIKSVCKKVFGGETVALQNEEEYSFSGKWDSITLYGSLSEAVDEEITPETSLEKLTEIAKSKLDSTEKSRLSNPDEMKKLTPGKLVELLWEQLVCPKLHKPTFVYDFPADTSPLVSAHRTNKGMVEKWDLYIRGFELATGYSELTDPVIQYERLHDQAALSKKGDAEAMHLDYDFLEALEYGMPPTAGMGMGIDRLIMAFTGLGLRDTITFPLVKPV
jgi:lysyl-tRNA synthetase class 2